MGLTGHVALTFIKPQELNRISILLIQRGLDFSNMEKIGQLHKFKESYKPKYLLGLINTFNSLTLPFVHMLEYLYMLDILLFFFNFIYLFLERGRKRGRETSMCGCLKCEP